ncbi:MAG TPA: V-type ATP synthase subunit D [Spirochaetota bacterium]|nr:V-type ATP synthase subunit D [Spirochaetota bacterium]
MILAVNATRMELMRLKKRLTLAQRGHKLLKDKQDELVRNFLEIIEDTKRLRVEVDNEIQSVFQSYSLAEGVVGGAGIESLFSMPGAQTGLKSQLKTIMNVKVPKFTVEITGDPYDYGDRESSVLVDRCVGKFGTLLENLLKLAELEKSSILLAEEIEKTRRRVNALEYILIPNIQDTIKYITMKLSEMERSNLTRIMKVKDMIQAKAEAALSSK